MLLPGSGRRWGTAPLVFFISAVVVLPAAAVAAATPFDADTVFQARKLRGLRAEIASLVLTAEPGGEVALEALAVPMRGEGGEASVPVFVEIDGASFLEHNQAEVARVEVYAYALGPESTVADYLGEVFVVDLKTHGEAVWQRGLKFYGHLSLPPGEYRLRVLVRNWQSKAAGLRELELRVPSFAAEAPLTLPPIFADPEGRDTWLPVRDWASGDGGGESAYPLVAGGRGISPATRPVLVAGRPSEAWIFGYGLSAVPSRGRLELLSGSQVVAAVDAQVIARGDGPTEHLKVAFELPGSLTPGEHTLRWAAAAAGGTAPAEIGVFVLDAARRERELLWTDLRWHLGSAKEAERAAALVEATAPAEVESRSVRRDRRSHRKRIRQLADGYRAVLATLASGPPAAARTALLDFESRTLADGSRASLGSLQAAQLAVAEELAAGDVESLIPVLVLHDELYQTYRQRRLFSLVFHTRTMVELLAELYAQRGGSQGSQVVTSRVLASLAGYLQDANLPASCRRLYARALEHDPVSKVALLGLAMSYERYGDYPRAVALLERLGEAYPRFGEGLVRLGTNLVRTGDLEAARAVFERVLELQGPAWARALAFQELARGSLRTGDLETAAATLERAIEEQPEEQGSYLLLAHVYDRMQRTRRAFELVRKVDPASRGESARKTYDSWPEAPLAEVRGALAEAAEVRLATLHQLLATSANKEVGP